MPQRKMNLADLIEYIPQANFAWNGIKGSGFWWSASEPDMNRPTGWGRTNAQYCHGITLDIPEKALVQLDQIGAKT